MSNIAIIGGHGKIALHLARILTDGSHTVGSLIRNPQQRTDITAAGATPVIADVENMTTDQIAQVLVGYDAVVWSAGAGGGSAERTYAVDRDAAIRSMDAARLAGVTRYVMASYKGSRLDHGASQDDGMFAYYEAKAAADDYLRETDLSWTILGPSALTQAVASGRIDVGANLPPGDVSRENVARVVAAILAKPATIGRFIEFNDGQTPIEEAVDAAS